MLQSLSGIGIDAARVDRDAPVHQLTLVFARQQKNSDGDEKPTSGGGLQVGPFFNSLNTPTPRRPHPFFNEGLATTSWTKRQDPPWKVVRAFPLPDSGALVHLNNVSGGVVAGDQLALDVEVRAGASAQITTTGATRLYRHRAGADDSEQRSTFSIGDGALLEYLPDMVIPYAGSRHCQRTKIQLGAGSTLFWWEILAPGRLAAGERFAFERLRVKTEIHAGTRPILLEDYLLEPKRKDPSAAARMFEYSHTASLCAIQEGRPPAFWRALEDHLNAIARRRTKHGEAVWGASMLASDGVVVRGLSMSGCFIHQRLIEFWNAARLAIVGVEAVPPRKIY